MTDEIGDPERCKEIVADRVEESDLRGRAWFHPVRAGTKRSTVDHSDPENLSEEIPSGNYGICASLTDTLVLIDIDDHKEGYDADALAYAREHLPETLTFSSAHDGEGRLYNVPVDDEGRLPVKRLKDEFRKANVSAVTWGEIRTENQYIVGAGSQLDADGCTKDDCTRCAEPDGGRYTIANDAPIATLAAADLVEILRQDPGVGDVDDDTDADRDQDEADSPVASNPSTPDVDPDTSPYRAAERLDAQRVAEETIVAGWNRDHSSGDDVEAFYPTWDPGCNGTANVVGEGGWRDTGGRGRGGPIEMAAIDCSDLSYNETVTPGDVTGADWRRAYEHLQELGFDLPDLSPTSLRDLEEVEDIDEAATALDALLDLYEGDSDREMDHWAEIWEAVGNLDPDTAEEYADRVANVCGVHAKQVTQHAEEIDHEEENGAPIVVGDGKTWYLAGRPRRRYELLNFEIDVESTLKVERGPLRARLTATLPSGETFTKAIEPKIFNKKERFDDEVLSESFATTFNVPQIGEDSVYTQDLLDALRKWVHYQDAPRRTGVRHMGLHSDEFALPGRTLTADGWSEDPEHVYLEREFGVERRASLPESDEYDAEAVAEIVETLPYTRDTERLLPVLGWFYAAPLRPIIESFSESGEFNHLSVTGDTGSGKTTTLGYLWRCFGMSGEPFSVDASTFAQLATFSATNSIPLWFDEYKPSDIREYKLDKFHDLYRKATRGAFAERGNADKTTTSYKIQAPVVVSGEQSIQGPAERRRSVMTQFRSETTDAATETAEAYKELVGQARIDGDEVEIAPDAPDPGDHALAFYRYATGLDDAEVQERWFDALEYAHTHLDELGVVEEMDDLEIQGVQTVVFGFEMMRAFATHVGADRDALPDYDALDDALDYVVERIGPGGQRKSHADRFVEIFGRAAAADYVQRGKDYEFVREGQSDEEIRVNLPRTYDAVSKYARDHDLDSGDLLNDHKDYRDRFTEMADDATSYVTVTRQYTAGVSQCTGLRTRDVVEEIEFDRAVLQSSETLPNTDSAEENDTDDDSDGSPPTDPERVAIEEIDPAKQNVATAVGEVEFGKYDGINDGDGPAWTATLSDGTARAELVVWDEEDIPPFYDAKGVFEPDALEVRGATVKEYEDTVQLVVSSRTTVSRLPDDGQAMLSEPDSGTAQAAADGGQTTTEDTAGRESENQRERFKTAYKRAETDGEEFIDYADLFRELQEWYDEENAKELIEKAKSETNPAWIVAVANRTFQRGAIFE
ncbi:bifunctional DNA primase/polymerase [Halobellus marinus]|uniref:bifunctional DNA primase/polymerase n=1 Tax=Halobellus sp. GCM10025813 TaxID=3252665 RepID=UPI0036215F01